MTGRVYEIAKWKNTFETAESRKYKSLNWVSVPIGFSSSGYQQLLDDFGSEAPAVYGAWVALATFAATCSTRGVLANSRGRALPISHIARVTGFDSAIFEKLIAWASSDEIGWLVSVELEEVLQKREEFEETDAPGESSGDIPDGREKNHATEHNRTVHNPAAASLAVAVAENSGFAGVDLAIVRSKALELKTAAKSLDRDWVWRLVAVGELIDPDLVPAAVKRIKSREVSKPQGYLEKVFREECTKRNRDFKNLLRLAPDPPPPIPATIADATGPPVTSLPSVAFKRPPRPERGIREIGNTSQDQVTVGS
jgi:hypothetical protein